MTVNYPQVQSTAGSHLSALLPRLLPYLGMFLLALLLWMPFGFKDMGLIEEISINGLLDSGHSLFFITPSSVMSLSRSRPLLTFSFSAAYTLDPNSYQFYNIFMMLFFFGKIVVVYWLVLKFLPGKKLLAFVVGLLFMLYPADTGLFALRVIHAHSAVLAYLLALYLLIQFRVLRGWISWLALLGAGLMIIFSLGQYQIALGAAMVTPFVLLYFGRPYRRTFTAAIAWYASAALIMVYEVWAGKQPGITAYEDALVPTSVFTREAYKSMLKAMLVGYERQINAWMAAFNKLNALPFYWPYIVAALVVSIGIGWWLLCHYRDAESQPISRWRYVLLIVGGILAFPIGISTYLPLPYYRFNEFRIYLLAMLGSAFVLALVLYLLTRTVGRYRDPVFLGLALPFIGLGFLGAFQQHQYYVNASLDQQSILQQIARQAPQLKPDTNIVVLDRAGTLNKTYVFYKGDFFEAALRYLYKDSTLIAGSCPFYGATAQSDNCQFEATQLRLTRLNDTITVPYDHMLLFSNDPNGHLSLLTAADVPAEYHLTGYDPMSRIVGQTLPYRMATLFSCDPALACYHEIPNALDGAASTTFDLSQADDIGFGWRETEYDEYGDFFHWSVNSMPWVDVNLSDAVDLSLEFRIEHWLNVKVIDSLKLSVNGQDIPLNYTSLKSGGRLYHATIPYGISAGQPIRQLIFKTDAPSTAQAAAGTKLGFTLYGLRVRPAQP